MSEVLVIPRPALPRTSEPYRVAVRRLRWLHAALRHQLAALTAQTGVVYELDERRLAAAFVAWLRRLEEQKPHHPAHRRAFFDFTAGLMLNELLSKRPVRATPPAGGPEGGRPEHVWPEGFACTVFCINMLGAVLAQEYDEATEIAPDFFDPRVWASFQENVREQASQAIGFLQLFVGGQPDWVTPTLFRNRFAEPDALGPSEVASASGLQLG